MDLRLVLANVNEWNFEASNLPEVASTPYRMENEPLDLDEGRVCGRTHPSVCSSRSRSTDREPGR